MTDNRKPSVRYARPADFVAFYGRHPPYTARAWVAESGGAVIGIAGWYRRPDGIALAFSDMADAMRNWPGTIMREARRFMASLPAPAICVANPDETGAPRFLGYLGWQEAGETNEGKVFLWLHPS